MGPLYFLLCLGLAASASIKGNATDENDQSDVVLPNLNCLGQWQAANPCANNPLNRLNFPLAADGSKFIQCGAYGRMFIVQCPVGETYDQATSTCIKPTQIVARPVNNLGTYGISNPCSAQTLAAGRLFFGVSTHTTKFVQCQAGGGAQLLTCPAQTVWSQGKNCCLFPAGVVMRPGTVGLGALSLSGLLGTSNPCPAKTAGVSTAQLYYSHPDPTKFIQCDLAGHAFVQQCPSGLLWNQALETCDYQATTTVPVYTGIIGNVVTSYLNGNGVMLTGNNVIV